MPTITIDNRSYEFEGRPRLLQFCLDNGVDLPHFCYHPSMSAPANCRQCLVDVGMPQMNRETRETDLDEGGNPIIQFMPKLQTSCSMDMADGMVVKTHCSSDAVVRAQKDTLEFLLINHPLDCPICDQAGHCPLQNQAYKHGPESSRFEFQKVLKPKHVDLGPNVVLDAERCINCTRCIRFTSEISKSNQLTIIERGVKNYPMTPPGIEFDDPYSMNVIDICPVGALTSKEHRFDARVWEMSKTASISTVGSKGSNCYYWVKDNRIMKVTPRTNMSVNEYWLSDEERLDYARFNENRPTGPTVENAEVSWEMAYKAASDCLSGIDGSRALFVGSAYATVEDNYLLTKLATAVGAPTPVYLPHVEEGHADGWLKTDDRAPNTQGCELLGIRAADVKDLKAKIVDGEVDVLYVLEDDLVAAGVCTVKQLKKVKVILHHYHTTNETLPAADVALPAAMAVETVGTFVNEAHRAQCLRPAKSIAGVNRTLSMEIGKCRADAHGTPFDKWYDESNLVNCQPGWVSIPEIASRLGHEMKYKGPRNIMAELAESDSGFTGATYEAMGEFGVSLKPIGVTA